MHSLSEIYTSIDSQTILLWLAMMLLITGIYNKKSALSIFSIALIGIVWYKMKGQLSVQSLTYLGINMMLVSAIAYFSSGIKNLYAQITYLLFASLLFFTMHSYFSMYTIRFYSDTIQEPLDQEAELLVRFDTQEDLKKWITEYKSTYDIVYPAFTPKDKSYILDEYLIVNLNDNDNAYESIREIEQMPTVAYVEGNELLELKLPTRNTSKSNVSSLSSKDPYTNRQWMAKAFDLEKFHKQISKASTLSAQEVSTIAILDTGVDANHEDLIENYVSTSPSYDKDLRGHGTHCAGIAAAVTGNNIGISSWIPNGIPVRITSIKVLSNNGIGSQRTIINGMIEAADKGYDVISMSLGGRSNPNREQTYREAVQYANDKGAIVVVAAGNSSMDAIGYSPANTPGVIAVSAIDSKMQLAEFSNKIDNITYGIAAPGTDIYSTLPQNEYGTRNGTSMAAPFVSGVVGLMKLYNPDITTEQTYNYLRESAIQKNSNNITNPIGAFQLMMQTVSAE